LRIDRTTNLPSELSQTESTHEPASDQSSSPGIAGHPDSIERGSQSENSIVILGPDAVNEALDGVGDYLNSLNQSAPADLHAAIIDEGQINNLPTEAAVDIGQPDRTHISSTGERLLRNNIEDPTILKQSAHTMLSDIEADNSVPQDVVDQAEQLDQQIETALSAKPPDFKTANSAYEKLTELWEQYEGLFKANQND